MGRSVHGGHARMTESGLELEESATTLRSDANSRGGSVDFFRSFGLYFVFSRFDLEYVGLERSGRPVGFSSTDSHTYKTRWCRVIFENPSFSRL